MRQLFDFDVVTPGECLEKLASVAIPVEMMPVTSVEVERNFSKTGQILTPQRHNLSDENFKGLAALYFNGDIESAWAECSK